MRTVPSLDTLPQRLGGSERSVRAGTTPARAVRNLLRLKDREREVEQLNREIAENGLKRYLPPTLVDDILAGRASFDVEPESRLVTLLFADFAGFTRASTELRAGRTARLVNEYLSAMSEVVFANGGTVDKFMGDGIMVIFGAPVALEGRDQASRAVACAIGMQKTFENLRQQWLADGLPDLRLRIGLHIGMAIVGSFGGKRRSDYTAIGPTVNLASRIEQVCTPGEVFATGEICDCLPEDVAEPAGEFALKGIQGKVLCFRIRTARAPHAPLARSPSTDAKAPMASG
jgi:class 3 adenylate cyclase